MKPNLGASRIGEISINRSGSKMIIEKYNIANDIWVKFIDGGYSINTTYDKFKKGVIKNPNDVSICGVGYLGVGDYKIKEDKTFTEQYSTWIQMLHRCYDKTYLENNPAYIECSVHPEWHNFQNFAKWYDENFYSIENEKIQLDKDILFKGNKIYSPKTCVFVPQSINLLFIKSNSLRGGLPIGVSFSRKLSKYQVHCRKNGEQFYLGVYDSREKAFDTYKTYKEQVIKQTADKYKENIPVELYEAMISYKVEITD